MSLRSPLPARPSGFIEPCLPTLARTVPDGPRWVFEVKHDGFRFMCRRDGDRVRVFSRSAKDWTDKVPAIVEAMHALPVKSVTIDGEGVVCDDRGVTDFERLRCALARGGSRAAFLYGFDLLELDGEDLRRHPWALMRDIFRFYQNYQNGPAHTSNAAHGHESRSLWIPEDATGFFTLWIAAFTGVLAFSTIGLWVATNRTARIAERALSEHERPWLFLEGARVTRREVGQQPVIPNKFFISLRWSNIGRSPALVDELLFAFEDINNIATQPDYSGCQPLDIQRTIAVNESLNAREVGPGANPKTANIQFVMYGRITYRELNGKIHHTGYAVQISPHIAAFSPWGNEAYDYYD